MWFVCRPVCVLATVSLYALAVAPHASAEDLAVDDQVESSGTASVTEPAPPPPAFQDLSAANSPLLRRTRQQSTDPYAAQGLRLGSFTLFPTLETGIAATSNMGQAAKGAKADAGLLLKPGLEIESDWSRHQFSASISGEAVRYLREEKLSTYGIDAKANLRLDVRRGTTLDVETGYELISTGASDSEVPDTAVSDQISHVLTAGVAVEHEAGFADLRLGSGVRRELYDNVKLSGGGVEDNGDRDFVEPSVTLRGTFNRGAMLRPFLETSYAPRIHDQSADRNGLRRDSKGYAATLGLRIDDDPLWSGEVGLTYLVRDYEDPTLATESAPGLLANLQWRPTELSKFDLSAGMTIDETSDAGSGGKPTWTASAKVTHALRDNLDLLSGVSISTSDASGGRDNTYGASAGLDWKLNPLISWSLLYEGEWGDSPGSSSDYDEQRLLTGIILKR